MAKSLYRSGKGVRRRMQQWRPYTCPVEVLLSLVPDSGSVFDIGCGCGLLLALALRSGKEIEATGLDISEAALSMAASMKQNGLTAEEGGRLRLHLSRGLADWPETTFDMVSLIDVMHHVKLDLRRPTLEAAIARVKPGGTLLYKDMCRRPRWRALLNWSQDLVVSRQWIRYTPIAQVEEVARLAGLMEERSETLYRLGFGHELRLYRRPG
ncbi:MAG TPA: methyltransferase domain-containing protein [Bryobacteraceae bacterium]|nr:methyltransferase domain-containing protein [Bryobacteraceae bacterium]